MRGTSRTEEGAAAIEQAGFEAALADPDRLGTVMACLEGVSVVCWLMGSATGSPEQLAALHGPRLEAMLERLVDTPVRGFVYEGGGSVPVHLLDRGSAAAYAAADTWSIPVTVVETSQTGQPVEVEALRSAVSELLV